MSTIADFERQIEDSNMQNQAKQMEMEQALKLLFGGGGKKPKEDENGNDQPNLDTKDSKIILGKRKRTSDSNTSLTLASQDSNVSIELKLAGKT